VSATYRYCPFCGGEVHAPLNALDAKPESFIDLLNSIYNLLADKANQSRIAYLSARSEEVIARRARLEFDEEFDSISRSYATRGGLPAAVTNLYSLALTNGLTGYAYRTIEEWVTHRRSGPMSQAESQQLLITCSRRLPPSTWGRGDRDGGPRPIRGRPC